ncbi:MAG: hypothetical protein OXF33_00335 [Rhodospirillales bacterium]|nr:hypothetical protein [Rhodospirillales bacterium]
MKETGIKSSGYENVIVDCPLCERELIFNRVSDLNTTEPIGGTRVSCSKCKGDFWISGDTINERHETIIFDCYDLLRTKRYMNCILNICQAYEMFFSLYLRVSLVYVPFGSGRSKGDASPDKVNDLFLSLSEATKELTFWRMRDIFLRLAISPNSPADLAGSEAAINVLQNHKCPKDAELENWPDKQISLLLMKVKRTQINVLRNKVVHKDGYRPKKEEAEAAVREARSILFPLTYRLDLHDDINSYLQPRQ